MTTEIVIARPREEVAEYAADPDNATAWYSNIKSVEWKTAKPLAVGSKVSFLAKFLGRQIAYTYEIVAFVPGERLVMRATEAPFPMETTYTWTDTDGRTKMTLRNQGGPSGLLGLITPLMAMAVRRSTARDLRRLKEILQQA